ncbi:MAG: hypothetical protein C0623_00745 [Desulfuromonas sp.]|nr:MAG: hypothetical protein C0623_00745 [Desulfuromonas sp.]
MKILVLGAGMYVTGRNGAGVGTILSSLAESSKSIQIDEVLIAARKPENDDLVENAANRINGLLGTSLKVSFKTISGNDSAEDFRFLCASDDFDCVILCVPDHLHFRYAEQAVLNGLHTLLVKPFVPTRAEADRLVTLAKEKAVHCVVEFHKRFDESNLYAKKVVTEGSLGKLQYISVAYSQKISIPTETFEAWSNQTNIFQYLGVHYVDLIYFLSGYLPVRAMAVGTMGALSASGIETFDSVHAQIVWHRPENDKDWFVSQLNTNWIDPVSTSAMSDQTFTIVGTSGRIDCDQKNRGIELVTEKTGVQAVNPYFSEYLPGPDGALAFGGYGHKSINLFLADVESLQAGDLTPDDLVDCRPSFLQSRVSTAVIEAVNMSLTSDFGWVEIDAFS